MSSSLPLPMGSYARRRQDATSPAFPRVARQTTAMYKARDRSNDLCPVENNAWLPSARSTW